MGDDDYKALVARLRNVHDTTAHEGANAIEAMTEQLDVAETEVEHYAGLAFVDLGANPPVTWQERAEALMAERDEAHQRYVDANEAMLDAVREVSALGKQLGQAQAENDRLTKELHQAVFFDNEYNKQVDKVANECLARAERAEAALRPFAEIAEKFPEDDDSEGICGVLLGDLRRARVVLAQIEKETGDD